jgi:AcrR family transcriptional regulator
MEACVTAQPAVSRDREATERRILDAARQVLADQGPQGFGVNAIARAAQCDKQLIYRYFGGLDGLITAVGTDLASWWADRLRPVEALGAPETYAELMTRLALMFLQALRDDPLMQKVVLWEVTSPTPQVQALARARSEAMASWMQRMRGGLAPPDGLDAPAANALLIAGVQHIVLASATAGGFGGLPLATEAEWDRLRRALRQIISRLYAGAG